MSLSFLTHKGQLCILVLPGLRWRAPFFNIEADLHLGFRVCIDRGLGFEGLGTETRDQKPAGMPVSCKIGIYTYSTVCKQIYL